jgi:hypothetical protein
MSKYIDADKLIAKIERLLAKAKNDEEKAFAKKDAAGHLAAVTKTAVCAKIKKFISTLQQEQPELPGYNKALLEVKSKVEEIYEETSIGLNEYDAGLYNGIAETCMKLRGFIKARLDSDERPEVDLDEKTMNVEIGKVLDENGWYHYELKDRVIISHIARRFYELGINAKK